MSESPVDIENLKFEVGGKYKNRKGAFEIMSMTAKKLVIKWDSGESIETTIEEQTRFIRNMELERRAKEILAEKARKKIKAPVKKKKVAVKKVAVKKK